MQFTVTSKSPASFKSGLLAVGVPAKDDKAAPTFTGIAKEVNGLAAGALKAAYTGNGFKGSVGQTHVTKGWEDVRLVLVGLGDLDKADLETLRKAAAAAVKKADKLDEAELHLALLDTGLAEKYDHEDQTEAIVTGAALAQYEFDRYKSKKDDNGTSLKHTVIVADGVRAKEARKATKEAATIAEAVAWSRDLANTPPNVANPEWMANQARTMAKKTGLTCKVLGVPDMKKLKMAGLLSVGQGSSNPPRLVILEHRPKQSRGNPYKTVALVGKGITFDTGGISIKPGAQMDEMKYDKSGACSVIATMQAVAELNLPLRVIGLAPLAENMPDGDAYRPGDIITMANGKMVEILNTDAEGRMVLADALWYAHKSNPDAIIDIATLTGAVDVALGKHYAGLMGSDDELINRIKEAGERSGERLWHLPLGEEYQDDIKATHGDIQNIGKVRGGGSLTAGQFLRNFVEEDKTKWAHLDVAAVAWNKENTYTPKGATGTMVRTFVTFMRSLL